MWCVFDQGNGTRHVAALHANLEVGLLVDQHCKGGESVGAGLHVKSLEFSCFSLADASGVDAIVVPCFLVRVPYHSTRIGNPSQLEVEEGIFDNCSGPSLSDQSLRKKT